MIYLYGVTTDRVDTDEQILDWCDRLYLQVQPEDARQLRLWPDHPPSLGNLLHEYTLRSEQVATGQASSQVLVLTQSHADVLRLQSPDQVACLTW